MKKKHIYTFLQVIIFIGLGLGLIYWRYGEMSQGDRDTMSSALYNIQWAVLIPIFFVGFLSHYFRALRWKILLRTVDINPSTANTTFAVLIGYMANSVVPRLGEVAKCTILAKYEKTAPEKAIGTIIGERAFDLLSLIIVMALTLVLEREIAQQLIDKYLGTYLYGNGSIWSRVLIIGGVLIISVIVLRYLFKRIKTTKLGQLFKNLGEGITSVWRLKERGKFLLYTLLIWLMYTLMVYIGYQALEATSHLGFVSALAIIAFGSIGMIVTPGGIGTYPLIVSAVLLLFGINEGIGQAFGWICWSVQTILVLVLGLASLALLPIVNKQKNDGQTNTHTA